MAFSEVVQCNSDTETGNPQIMILPRNLRGRERLRKGYDSKLRIELLQFRQLHVYRSFFFHRK